VRVAMEGSGRTRQSAPDRARVHRALSITLSCRRAGARSQAGRMMFDLCMLNPLEIPLNWEEVHLSAEVENRK